MKAIFYNEKDIPVMETYQNVRNEFNSGNKAIRKGATHARLFEAGKELDIIFYHPNKKKSNGTRN